MLKEFVMHQKEQLRSVESRLTVGGLILIVQVLAQNDQEIFEIMISDIKCVTRRRQSTKAFRNPNRIWYVRCAHDMTGVRAQ